MLKLRRDFEQVREKGTSFVTKHFLVSWRKVSEAEETRLGISITKKIDKRSARRNRLRRRIKEAVRQHLVSLNEPHCHWVIVARKEATELEFAEVVRQIKKAVVSLGIGR